MSLQKELGNGAMGFACFAQGIKIGRVIANKTLTLRQEFEGQEPDDVRECFSGKPRLQDGCSIKTA